MFWKAALSSILTAPNPRSLFRHSGVSVLPQGLLFFSVSILLEAIKIFLNGMKMGKDFVPKCFLRGQPAREFELREGAAYVLGIHMIFLPRCLRGPWARAA